jgi:hypothetical protein
LRQNFGAAGWMVIVGLLFGLLGGIMSWIRAVHVLFGPSTAEAYRRLPSLDPPWVLAIAWATPNWLMTVFYFVSLGFLSFAGLIVAALVRPKNRAADVAAGLITGFVYGAAVLVLSLGAVGATFTAVEPIREDLVSLSEAAWAEPANRDEYIGPRPVDRLLQKYPDFQKLPPRDRGRVFSEKFRADLIARFPPGIWIGVLISFPLAFLIFTTQVMAAGPLLRQQEGRVVLPYLERVVPAMLLIAMAPAIVILPVVLGPMLRRDFPFDLSAVLLSFLPMLGLLVMAFTAVRRGWPWPLRLMLHAGWLFGAGIPSIYWSLK